jgi:hypothetical protein
LHLDLQHSVEVDYFVYLCTCFEKKIVFGRYSGFIYILAELIGFIPRILLIDVSTSWLSCQSAWANTLHYLEMTIFLTAEVVLVTAFTPCK